MSEVLKRSSGATLTVTNLTPHSDEINTLLEGERVSPITSTNQL